MFLRTGQSCVSPGAQQAGAVHAWPAAHRLARMPAGHQGRCHSRPPRLSWAVHRRGRALTIMPRQGVSAFSRCQIPDPARRSSHGRQARGKEWGAHKRSQPHAHIRVGLDKPEQAYGQGEAHASICAHATHLDVRAGQGETAGGQHLARARQGPAAEQQQACPGQGQRDGRKHMSRRVQDARKHTQTDTNSCQEAQLWQKL